MADAGKQLPDWEIQVVSPGRVNLLGEHVDYNQGMVLPIAIDRFVRLAARPRADDLVVIESLDLNSKVQFRLSDLEQRVDSAGQPLAGWALYLAGVAWALRESGLEVRGLDAVITSDLPIGAGLSSSAALELAFAVAWQTACGWQAERMQLALLCQRAENAYAGVNCGLMDQFACAHGVARHVLYFDTRDLQWQPLPMPPDTAVVIASLTAGSLLSPRDRHPTAILLVVMGVVIFTTSVTFLSAHEESSLSDEVETRPRIDLKDIFQVDHVAHSDFIWLVVSRFVFLLGVYGVQAFAQYYIQDVIGAANPVKATSQLMAALALMLVVSALLGGWLADRFGARRVVFLASLISALGCGLLLRAGDMDSLIRYAGVLGAGIGLYLTADWTLASRKAPVRQAGKYLGLINLATAGASAASRLLGVPIDILNNARPGLFFGYRGLFLLGVAGALLSLLILAKVKEE